MASSGGAIVRLGKAVIEEARTKCRKLMEERSIAETGRKGTTITRIVEVGERCLTLRPPLRPSVPTLVEMGRLTYGDAFPAGQTIYNHYAAWANVWMSAYDDLVSVQAPKTRVVERHELEEFREGDRLDVGTAERLNLMNRRIRDQAAEIRTLRSFISSNIPAPDIDPKTPGTALLAQPDLDLDALRQWLAAVDDGSLRFTVDDLGVSVTRGAGPTPRIMPIRVLAVLRKVAGGR
ncbi:hypothetical protein [Aureimonas sp. Leaf324]|uniref:hypothetical protein n=1 Tax=Aureimonas sp. Leaf324 TaxID=1736336 RepID=UPI0006FAE6CB|nr:hypothetical protein [Aureimonas sp. Leaf324]KQQ88675.1 hypothetical protein ASF65_17785 [Aureimonas sp. Leaf324]